MKVTTKELLFAMKMNSKLSHGKLGEKFDVTEAAIRKRIKKLRDQNFFTYTIDIDYKKLGYEISAFIGFDAKPETYHSIIDKLHSCENNDNIDIVINSIYQTSIDHDFMIDCAFKTNDDLTAFLKELEDTPGVLKVCPAIINQKIR